MLLVAWWGPTTIEEALRLCDETMARTSSKRVEAQVLITQGAATAVQGRLDQGREDVAAGRELLLDLGHRISWAGISAIEAEMELEAGDPERAYAAAAEGHDVLAASAETGYLATVVGYQAQAALALGRDDEALRLADEARELAALDDFEPRARERFVRAQVLARRGDIAGADELIAAAAELVDPTDWLDLHIGLALARAEVARLAGSAEEERQALERALVVAEAKGNVVTAERARQGLGALNA
jgi:tetratricopeptide (TPR) repeat protein